MSNTPKLRFKDDNGEDYPEWASLSLSKVATKIADRNIDFRITNVITNSAIKGLIKQRDYFDKDIANDQNIDKYFIIEYGDFVYNPRRSTEAPYGPIKMYKNTEPGIVSPIYLCFRLSTETRINVYFLAYYFYSNKWHAYIHCYADRGARHDRVSMLDSRFFEMQIPIPTIKEQTKIANFLTLFDKKIEKQAEKVAALEEYKKGLMQKIFSREIRFKDDEGKDYPEWESKQLKDLGSISSGVGFSDKYQGLKDLEVNVYKVSDMNLPGNDKYMINANNTVSLETCKMMKTKPVNGPAIMFAKVGAAIFLERKRIATNLFLVDNNMMYLKPKTNTSVEFIYYLLNNTRLSKFSQVGALPSYNASDIGIIKVSIPTLPEQTKIAKFLTLFDRKVEKEKGKLRALREQKQGLLQQMFV